jgi:hypothetical protein
MAEVAGRTERDPRRYWAAEPADAFAGFLETKIREFYDHIASTEVLEHWRELYRAYHGEDPAGSPRTSRRVTSGGEAGEVPELCQNEFRSVIRQQLVMATGARPAITAESLTPDFRSLMARKMAEAIIKNALARGTLEAVMRGSTEVSLFLGEAGTYQWWDPDAGKPLLDAHDGKPVIETVPLDDAMPDEMAIGYRDAAPAPRTLSRIVRQGDIRELTILPDRIIRDPKAKHWPEDAKWVAVVRPMNRWDLAARYPKHADHVLRASGKAGEWHTILDSPEDELGDDEVWGVDFYHLPSSALPKGRASLYVQGRIIADTLDAGAEFPYDRLPLHIIRPARKHGSAFGYSKGSDILGPSEALNSAAITALANHDALGFQKVWIRKGSGLGVRDIAGVKVLESTEAPVPLKLMETNEASFQLADYWKTVIERLSGMNAVARGEPQPSLKSGTALLFVHAQAQTANSDTDLAFTTHCSEVFSARIEIMRRFCKEPRLIEIAGANKATFVRSFKGDDLSSIDRITVDFGSPVLRNHAGRMELGEKLFAAQAITRDQYMDLIATGRWEPVSVRPEMHAALIASENEMIMNPQAGPGGAPVEPVALKTDRHDLHVPEHRVLADDPYARYDNAFIGRLSAHDAEHLYWWHYMWLFEPASAMAQGLPQPGPLVLPMPPPPRLLASLQPGEPPLPVLQPPPPVVAAPPGPGPGGANPGPPPGSPGGAPAPGPGAQQPPPPSMPGADPGAIPQMPVMPEQAGQAVAGAAPGMAM